MAFQVRIGRLFRLRFGHVVFELLFELAELIHEIVFLRDRLVERLLAFETFARAFVFAARRFVLESTSADAVARTAAARPAADWLSEAAAVVFGVEQLQQIFFFRI